VSRSKKLPQVTFHALRHTHASQLIDANVDIVTISKRMGHAKPDITLRIYAHLFKKDDSKAAEAINQAFNRQQFGSKSRISQFVLLRRTAKALK
jgi:integrase